VDVAAGEVAEAVDVDAELVDRGDDGRSCSFESAKSSLPQPGAMWTMPVPRRVDIGPTG
jgi:hypothetical protein